MSTSSGRIRAASGSTIRNRSRSAPSRYSQSRTTSSMNSTIQIRSSASRFGMVACPAARDLTLNSSRALQAIYHHIALFVTCVFLLRNLSANAMGPVMGLPPTLPHHVSMNCPASLQDLQDGIFYVDLNQGNRVASIAVKPLYTPQ